MKPKQDQGQRGAELIEKLQNDLPSLVCESLTRIEEIYDYLNVVRVIDTVGFKLIPDVGEK